MASGTGLFALYQGLVKPQHHQDQVDVRVYAVNTGQELVVSVDLNKRGQEYGDPRSYPVKVTFLAPGGTMTGQLLPVKDAQTTLYFECPQTGSTRAVRTTLIDCANPFVLVDSRSLPAEYHLDGPSGKTAKEIIESIRCAAMVRMGLQTAAYRKAGRVRRGTPKIVLLTMPSAAVQVGSPNVPAKLVDVEVVAYSMGNPHPTLQLTGAICLGAALSVPGTVAWDLLISNHGYPSPSSEAGSDFLSLTPNSTKRWCIQHPTGFIESKITTSHTADGKLFIESGSVFCSARKLFEGTVFY
ncbi:hypothetical protein EYZ11_007142 [Aspergillus tanneri]|uniref:Uncharacterized protein n=1 Tax=Aspergillus tanneri TaxID=1220188 RepID=A0A4S3JE79_9EURO|nr:hypothetical protein EYZ11_007142 [Aspergillus tanneri]